MGYDFDKSAHAVYALNYHLIICTKYRRNVFEGLEVIDELKTRTRKIAKGYGIRITNQEVSKDHTHILFSATPQTNLVKFVNALKGGTSKAIRHHYPEVKEKLWKDVFWSDSYCLITTGQVTLDQLKKYVESQGEK